MHRLGLLLAVGAAYLSIAGSIAISLVWFVTLPGLAWFEPALQTLSVVACLAGVIVERRAAGRERRRLALSALSEELARCAAVLDDPRFVAVDTAVPRGPRVYPRLPVSAVSIVLASGALAEHQDAGLLCRLHEWRDAATGFNHRLDLTELRLFTVGAPVEIGEFERVLSRDGGYLCAVRRQVAELRDCLCAGACQGGRRNGSSVAALAAAVARGVIGSRRSPRLRAGQAGWPARSRLSWTGPRVR